MDKEEWVEKEVQDKDMPAHNKSVLRSIKRQEFEFWEKEAVRVDNNRNHDDL